MSENWEGWTVSEKYPGYYCKTIRRGMHTANIYRPILTPDERAAAEKRVMDDLAQVARAEIARKQKEEIA